MVDETRQSDSIPPSNVATIADVTPIPPQNQPDVTPENNPEETQPAPFLWLKRSDQLVLGVVLILSVGLTLIYWIRLSAWGQEVVEIDRQQSQTLNYQLDINTATWVELSLLEGIGETIALRIVEDRKQNGLYQTIDDLQRVRGIGKKTVEKLRANARVGDVQ